MPVCAEQVTVTLGAMEGIYAALTALVEPGDEVLVPDPGFPNIPMAVQTRGGSNVCYPLCIEHGFIPRLSDLERLVTPRTKLLVINSPGNPTGAVFSRATVEALMEFARRHDLWVLADEVYEQLVFEGEHVSPMLFDSERVVSVHSFSKSYAMTGWRVGYTITPLTLARVLTKIQEPIVASVPAPLQKAAEAALLGPQDCVDEMRATYRARRDAVLEILKEYGLCVYVPRGAFYVLVDIRRARLPSREFALKLLEEKRVAVAPGSAFGCNGHSLVRVSLASETNALIEGVRRLCELVISH
jgi:aspartate aminotransferase/aminotransferase